MYVFCNVIYEVLYVKELFKVTEDAQSLRQRFVVNKTTSQKHPLKMEEQGSSNCCCCKLESVLFPFIKNDATSRKKRMVIYFHATFNFRIFAWNMEAKLCSFLLWMCESNEGTFCHNQQRYLS